MTTFVELEALTPDIRNQYDWWRGVRKEQAENSVDWDAFREHITAIGQPDPGNRPPDNWVGDDFKEANRDRWDSYQQRG